MIISRTDVAQMTFCCNNCCDYHRWKTMCKGYMTTCCAIWQRFNSLLLHFAINPSFYCREVLIELTIRGQEGDYQAIVTWRVSLKMSSSCTSNFWFSLNNFSKRLDSSESPAPSLLLLLALLASSSTTFPSTVWSGVFASVQLSWDFLRWETLPLFQITRC